MQHLGWGARRSLIGFPSRHGWATPWLLLGLGLTACHGDVAAPRPSSHPVAPPSASSPAKGADITGRWRITKVTGGPAVVHPGGRNMPGFKLDLNQVWSAGLFEFRGGIGSLTLAATGTQQIGGYEIQGGSIVFEGQGGARQRMAFTLNGDEMALSLSPEEYQNAFGNAAAGGAAVLEVESAVVFHLRRE